MTQAVIFRDLQVITKYFLRHSPSHHHNSHATTAKMAPTKLEPGSEELYEKCYANSRQSPEGLAKIFSQDELIAFGVVEDGKALLPLVQGLMDAQLFRVLRLDDKICYAIRPRDDALK